jgi:thiosulfate/3-mercaptopyruvate sulfurtransferase
MKSRVFFLFTLLFACKEPAPPSETRPPIKAETPPPARKLDELPPGNGRDLVIAKCQICHAAQHLLQQRLTAAQWKATLDKMAGWGAPVAPEEAGPMLEYLSTSFPVDLEELVPRRVAAPEGAVAESGDAFESFGKHAAAKGYKRPELMVSPDELRSVIASSKLRLIDVRPKERFEQGHIPGAQNIDRGDYSVSAPISGLSRSAKELEALLQRLGVGQSSVVVIYGDGGAEPYRFWWTLKSVAGYTARILDGGLEAWKQAGEKVASGPAGAIAPGDVRFASAPASPVLKWSEIDETLKKKALLIDARKKEEFSAGRIPGSVNLEWTELLRSEDKGLLPVEELRARLEKIGAKDERPVISYCQSGTRSAVTYYALLELGWPEASVLNYNGSWSEFSRLDLPIETGEPK